ncbi:MAG: YicC family protein [Rhodospirillaceae bacterium]|nr:YicC family protein [Rhodospirillaceae bacterium]
MTGFARAEGQMGVYGWSWELKSVNAKGLDMRVRLPPGTDALEGPVRDRIAAKLKRGNVTASLTLARAPGSERVIVNEAALDAMLALPAKYAGRIDPAPPRLDALLAVRGIVEVVEAPEDDEARAERNTAILATLDEALDRLGETRRGEGARLAALLHGQIGEIGRLIEGAEAMASARPEKLRVRLEEQLRQLLEGSPPMPEERLAQEVALLAARGDIREELDRLRAHCAAAAEALAKPGAIGRRLDFLAQEFNREANTLCSKSSDVDLTRLGIELKTVIDQFREQIQNVE